MITRQILNRLLLFTDTDIVRLNVLLKELPFKIDEEEKIKIYLYFLTEKAYLLLAEDKQSSLTLLAEKTAQASSDPRVSGWETLSEFSRVKIVKQFRKYLDKDLPGQIDFYSALLFNMLKKGWAEVEWQNLPKKEQDRIIHSLSRRYAYNPVS